MIKVECCNLRSMGCNLFDFKPKGAMCKTWDRLKGQSVLNPKD